MSAMRGWAHTSAAVVQCWTKVHFKVWATAGTECEVQCLGQACMYFVEPVQKGSNVSEPMQKPWLRIQ